MDPTRLASIVGLLIALSIASERLVEIIKGLSQFLDKQHDDETKERRRRAALQVLAVAAGIVTAFLARPVIPQEIVPATSTLSILALGLLASGGSGFWNSVLTYLLEVKNLKELTVKAEQQRKTSGARMQPV